MGTSRRWRAFLTLLGLPALLLAAVTAASAADDRPDVNVVRISGAVDGAYADYISREVRGSAERGDVAVVLQLSGSGSIKVDDVRLVRAIADADVPVVAWVGPVLPITSTKTVSGLHTALWLAADARFVAHGAVIRSYNPLARGGDEDDAVDLPGITDADELRDPDVRLTAADTLERGIAVSVPRSGDDQGRITPGTVNAITDVVRALDGRVVRLPSGERTINVGDLQSFDIRNANPGLIARVRQALASNPTLTYLLLLVGIGAIVFELFQPGFGPAGWSGALLVAFAAYGLVALPTNPIGLAITLFGLAALAVDVGRGGLGVLTWGGTAGLLVGSRLLIHSDGPELLVPWSTIAFGVVGSWVFYVVVMTVVLRALRGQSAQMGQALVGRVGEVRSTLNPQGHVLVEGALWRARALEWDGPVDAGTRVEIASVDEEALILDVVPLVDAR